MFEFIGIVVVILIVGVILKGLLGGAIKGTRFRSCDYAASLGVPFEVAQQIHDERDLVKQVRNQLARGNREFAMRDVYEQYGQAIAAIYEQSAAGRDRADGTDIVELVEPILKPQIEILKHEGSRVHVNHDTFVYVALLATCIAERQFNLEQVHTAIEKIFDEVDEASIQQAYHFAEGSSDFEEKCRDLLPVVLKEVEAGAGEFYLKYTRKANQDLQEMFEGSDEFDPEDFDPAKISRTAWMDV